ncbi:MAG: SH3 domain-containing protein [Acidobacteriota bacterium]
MPTADAIRWFKSQFHEPIEAAVRGTPFTLDFVTAVACQETGFIWSTLRTKLTTPEVLAMCVGDTADSKRTAFPRTRAELVAAPGGQQMFDIARQAVLAGAPFFRDFKTAATNPNKFCHGFGLFQYDLQFFRKEPDYFLQKRYADFSATLGKALEELTSKQKKIGFGGRTTLTDEELTAVAIAYNTGTFRPSRGLKQGFFNGTKFYGEAVFDFLRLSKTVSVEDVVIAPLPPPPPGTAPVPPPTPVTATGAFFRVDVISTPLNLREGPSKSFKVKASLPDGQLVRAVTGKKQNGFLEVETSLNGALLRGFASASFLKPVEGEAEIPVERPSPTPPATGIVAVNLLSKTGGGAKRTQLSNALSLNENGQPSRTGETAEERRASIAAILDWLAVDKPTHLRYRPHDGLTFCNIYAHDFCHLAGCYLPRVWWSSAAIEALALGRTVEPRLGRSVDEQRANDLFRWLRDFGMRFGWRRTGALTTLQTEVNQGAVGLIVARRVIDGKSGHIVPVVPELGELRARRNAAGEVIAPLQSQAGAVNFRVGTGTTDWFRDEKFAEFAFWLHA